MPCEITDESGITQYSYDSFGNATSQIHTELGVEYTVSYVWNDEDRLEQMIMPRGRAVIYSKDSVCHIAGISTTVNGVRQDIVSYIRYCADNKIPWSYMM